MKKDEILLEQLNNLTKQADLAQKQMQGAEGVVNMLINRLPQEHRKVVQEQMNRIKKVRNDENSQEALKIHKDLVNLTQKYKQDASKDSE